jgi:6-phosphogluconolactonase
MRTPPFAAAAALALTLAASAGATSPAALYVTNGSGANVGQFGIGAGGLLAPLTPPTVAAPNPTTAVITPDGKHVYAVGGATLYAWDVQTDLTLAPHTPSSFPLPIAAAAWMGISPDGKSLYIPNFDTAIAQMAIAANGDVSAKSPATVAGGPQVFSVAMTPDGKHLYAANAGGNKIARYDVAPDGTLTVAPGLVSTGTTPSHMAITPDGRFAYVTDGSDNTVHQYAIGADGALSALSPAAVVTSPNGSPTPDGIAASPDGKTVYVTNINDSVDSIAQFTVGTDGTLTPKAAGALPGSLVLMIAPTPDGSSVYVTSLSGHSVLEYDAAADGALTAKSTASVASGGNPFQLLVTPDQGPAAAFTATPPAAAAQPASFDGSASSDADGSVTRYDWDFGDGATAANAGPTVSHTYAAAGTYTVRLRVTDDRGCAGEVWTGLEALCNDHGAVVTHDVTAPAAPSTAPTGAPPGGSPTLAPSDGPGNPAPRPRAQKRCRVPKLTRKTLPQARKRLSKAHCRLGKVTRKPPTGDRPVVVAQRPKPGQKRKAGFAVNVVVSGRA